MQLHNLSESVQSAVKRAISYAKELSNEHFSGAHLMTALLRQDSSLTDLLHSVLKPEDVTYISEWAEAHMEFYPSTAHMPDILTGDATIPHIFEKADGFRIQLGLDKIMPICVLAALVTPGLAFTIEQLKSLPLRERDLAQWLNSFIEQESLQQALHPKAVDTQKSGNTPKTHALYKYCIDKIAWAHSGKNDAIIGRDQAIRTMMEILGRRTKPNVLIVGEPGVGKTALVHGFVSNIVSDKVPESLKNTQVFELDIGALTAGASYKGEVADRFKHILKELQQLDKSILFIDELHILVQATDVTSGLIHLLVPALSQGTITLIGSSTPEKYKKVIEPAAVLNRRFEILTLEEPDNTTAIKMVHQVVGHYEQHHALQVQPAAIEACVLLAKRYIKDRSLPDAAIDLLDRTLSATRLMKDTAVKDLEAFLEELSKYQQGTAATASEQLKELQWMHQVLLNKLNPMLLGLLDQHLQEGVQEDAATLYAYLLGKTKDLLQIARQGSVTVGKQEIAAMVAHKTGIPLGKIQVQEREKLLHLEAHLQQRVIGQDHALKAVAAAILESRSGMNKPGQPIGSFFFLGPTGTGKTELAKAVADFLFNDEKAIIRFDMSEFKEEHSAALLYGAPPGYIGYEEGGVLVNKIRKQPYAIVLLDEIEKAHPSIFDTFLQIMDEGQLHDRLGKEGDFSNALIIFTSNIASDWLSEQITQGAYPTNDQLMDIMAHYFRPEFLARLSEIVPFAPITEDHLVSIFNIQLKSLLDALHKQGITFTLPDAVRKALAGKGFTPKYGARQIGGIIRHQLRRPIARMIVAGTLKRGDQVSVTYNNKTKELAWKVKNGNGI